MQGASTTKRKQRKEPRIISLFKRNRAYSALHTRVYHADNAKGRLLHTHPQLLCQPCHALKSAFGIERKPATEKKSRVDAPQDKIRIGDGQHISLAITQGARISAGRVRTDVQRITLV